MSESSPENRGFTLVEMSIVLVIIGLIIGGVLVAQDLIRLASVRATVSQVEKYNSAVNTFRGKYGYLPGDIPPPIASSFGFFAFGSTCNSNAGAGTIGCGDGDGLIENMSSLSSWYHNNGEQAAFWRHLSDANLIDGQYGVAGNAAMQPSGMFLNGPSNVALNLPPAKVGAIPYFMVSVSNNQNYFFIDGIVANTFMPWGYSASRSISALDAYAIDNKIDDGMPNTGVTTATGCYDIHDAGVGCCTVGGSGSGAPDAIYEVPTLTPVCTISIKFE